MTEQCRTSSTNWYRDFKRVRISKPIGAHRLCFTQSVLNWTFKMDKRYGPFVATLLCMQWSRGKTKKTVHSFVFCFVCSGDNEAEGILSEVGHGGSRGHKGRAVQHEDSSRTTKRYEPTRHAHPPRLIHCTETPSTIRWLLWAYHTIIYHSNHRRPLSLSHTLTLRLCAALHFYKPEKCFDYIIWAAQLNCEQRLKNKHWDRGQRREAFSFCVNVSFFLLAHVEYEPPINQ